MQEQSIFVEALDKADPAERAAFLNRVCASDPALRQRIERLLQRHQQADSFLEPPAAALGGTVDEPLTERPGSRIGPYKLLQQIGEGGMGVVYMAEQQQPVRRKVALKIIKPGLDSKQVIARFEAERQALALMEHQNIAKVLDAGATESGRPYFVMELVHGVPLTQYCDDHHLTPKQRLELFLPVCHAIQHAHQKGIIHRDLKPSNVLVCLYDGVAVPKVIDFGVAKATGQQLTERTMFTQFGSLVGTLEYMSPEQAEMSQLGIDTRSDVYALGVLLYELLTGTTPLDRHRLREAGFDEIRRLIREEEPPRPSTRLSTSGVALAAISAQRQTEPAKLTRLVRGELDWIVMRCLEKDRTRRYETANGLARDLQHYLADEPVEACPPTTGYKLRKFARKNKKLLATAAAFVALLLLGVAASAWQAVRATQAEAAARAQEQQANANALQAQVKEQEATQQRDEAQRQRDEVRALNERLQRTLYAAHMNLAQHAWEAGGTEQVEELLEHHRPKPGESDLRGFEWYYLYRLCHSEVLALKGHTDVVRSVAYSPDGKRLASGSDDQTVKVWNAQTGQELLTFHGHSGRFGQVNSVAFSPDGRRLASSASGHRTVKVWDAQTGQELLSLGHTDGVMSMAFSPDGKRLASGSTRAAGREPGEVKVWDAQTGQELLTCKGHTGYVYSVAFGPDGKRLASGSTRAESREPGEVKVWEAQTGQELLTCKGHTGGVTSVAFSPDGKRLASASFDETVKVWDAQTGQELLTCKGHTSAVYRVAFSPDGKRLASTSYVDKTAKVWDAQTGQELLTLRGYSICVAFSPDGKHLASGGDRTVKVFDAQTGQKPLTLRGGSPSVDGLAPSPDSKRLASAGREGITVWDAQTGQELLSLKGGYRVAFSPDGKRLASASVGRTVKVWEAQTGQELLSLKGGGGNVVFSPDGKRLASPGRVWDAQTGQEILSLTGGGAEVTFSPDGKRLAGGSSDNTMKVWDAQTGQELLSLKGHIGLVNSVAFSPDGKRLASAARDKTVKVWDAQTGQELLSLKGHSRSVHSVVFSSDGTRLASVSSDHTLKVWDATSGQELLTLKEHTGPVLGVAFSPNGHWLASGSMDGTVKIWDATPLPQNP